MEIYARFPDTGFHLELENNLQQSTDICAHQFQRCLDDDVGLGIWCSLEVMQVPQGDSSCSLEFCLQSCSYLSPALQQLA